MPSPFHYAFLVTGSRSRCLTSARSWVGTSSTRSSSRRSAIRSMCNRVRRAATVVVGAGAATGGFRAQFATAINVRLSLLSRAKLLI